MTDCNVMEKYMKAAMAHDVSEEPLYWFYLSRCELLCGNRRDSSSFFEKGLSMLSDFIGEANVDDSFSNDFPAFYDGDFQGEECESECESEDMLDGWYDDVFSDAAFNRVNMLMVYAGDMSEQSFFHEAVGYYLKAYGYNRNLYYPAYDETNMTILSEMTLALFKEEKNEYAEKVARLLVSCYPYDSWGWNILGEIQNVSGKYDDALRSFIFSRTLQPDSVAAGRNIAFTKFFLKDYEGAVEEFENYLKVCPEDNFSKITLAEAYSFVNEYDKMNRLLSGIREKNNDVQDK